MEIEDKIEITGVDLVYFVKECYKLSNPVGMGHLHFEPGELPLADAQAIVKRYERDGHLALSMDYVKGRCVKMHVWRVNGRLYIRNRWFDHGSSDLTRLLIACGIDPKDKVVQGIERRVEA